MSEKTYRIKPLAWERVRNKVVEQFSAPAIGVGYEVWRLSHSRKWWWTFDDGKDPWPDSHRCRTAAEGKAAADAHWRETITRFLEEVTHE